MATEALTSETRHAGSLGTKDKVVPTNRSGASIGTAFTSLSKDGTTLPLRFKALKQELSKGRQTAILEGWYRLLSRLEGETLPQIKAIGSNLVPEVEYSDIVSNGGELPESAKAKLKTCGTLIVRGVVSQKQALDWKQDVRDYIAANPATSGFPKNNIQVYELYWSKAQLAARSHPNMLTTQRALNNVWVAKPEDKVVLGETLSYADRLRIRTPGDRSFNLGPHLDGGSLERWEDIEYRKCYSEIFNGNWENHDPFNVSPRLGAIHDLYHGPGGCSIFRSFQGWLSLSDCGPGQGTLRVMPDLLASTAYVIMRPFVKPVSSTGWDIDDASSAFHGAAMGAGQELSASEHPLLKPDAFVSVPTVHPGDAVFWHCDVAHMVEPEHNGLQDSSVFYIPIIPLCDTNVQYISRQREAFEKGFPPPDFPGGVGESQYDGRGHIDSISPKGLAAMGYPRFDIPESITAGARAAYETANLVFQR